jgi:hypothetical protein
MPGMIQFILFDLAKVLQRIVVLLIALPVLALVATPTILIRASLLAARKRQRFRFATVDGYDALWNVWLAAFY